MIFKVVLVPTKEATENSKCNRDFMELLVFADSLSEMAKKVEDFMSQPEVKEREPKVEFLEIQPEAKVL